MSAGSRESQSPASAIVTVPPFWVDGLKTLSTAALKPVVAALAAALVPPPVDALAAPLADTAGLAFLLLPHAVTTSAATEATATTAVIRVLLIFFWHPYFSCKSWALLFGAVWCCCG